MVSILSKGSRNCPGIDRAANQTLSMSENIKCHSKCHQFHNRHYPHHQSGLGPDEAVPEAVVLLRLSEDD